MGIMEMENNTSKPLNTVSSCMIHNMNTYSQNK